MPGPVERWKGHEQEYMLRPSESLRAAVDAKKAEMGLEPNASFAGMHVRRGDKVKARPTRYCSPIRPTHFKPLFLEFNSVSGLVSKSWYRSPFDHCHYHCHSELSVPKIPPTDSPNDRAGYDQFVSRPWIQRR